VIPVYGYGDALVTNNKGVAEMALPNSKGGLMKKLILAATAMLLVVGTQAFADEQNPQGWSCNMEFTAKGKGLQIFIGKFKMKGEGVLQCENDRGDMRVLPVKVTMGGKPIQAQVAAGWLRVKGHAKAIGISENPESLFGKYYVAKAQFAIIGGVGTQAGFDVEKDGNLAFNMSLQTIKGFGFSLGVTATVVGPNERGMVSPGAG
jgi:hypothetical protein